MLINHVGYVVDDIDVFKSTFPDASTIKRILDPIQNANIELLQVGGGCSIELIQPLSPDAFTWNFLKKFGQGLHHICYEGLSIQELDILFKEKKMIKIRGPIPAILFDKNVIFAMTRSKSIIEFIV